MTEKTIAQPHALFDTLLGLSLSDVPISVCLASSPKDALLPQFARLQLSAEVTENFRSIAAYALKKLKRDKSRHDIILHPYTVETKPEPYEIEYLRLTEYEQIAEQLQPLNRLIDIELFEEEQHFLSNLRFYVIVAQIPEGDPIYFLRSYTQKRMLTHPSRFAIWRSQNEYEHVTQPVFVFDSIIDGIAFGDMLFLMNKNNIHGMFRYFELVRKVAHETLEFMRGRLPLHNFDAFANDCHDNLLKLVKLRHISTKPYLDQISMDDIKKVIQRCELAIKITEVDGQEKLIYDARDSWTILRILDDDYLSSILTSRNYEVTGKREMK